VSFLGYSVSKNIVTLKSGSKVTQGHRNRHRSIRYDVVLTIHTNHGPSSYRFRDRRRILSKIAKFSHCRVLYAPADGKTGMMGYQMVEKVSRWFSRLDSILACDRQTDRQTDIQTRCDSSRRAMLRVARGKRLLNLVAFSTTEKSYQNNQARI